MTAKNRTMQYAEIIPFFTDETDDLRYNLYINILLEHFYNKNLDTIKRYNQLTTDEKKNLQMMLRVDGYEGKQIYTTNTKDFLNNTFKNHINNTSNAMGATALLADCDWDPSATPTNNIKWFIVFDVKNDILLFTDNNNKYTINQKVDDFIFIHPEWIGFYLNMINKFKLLNNDDVHKKKIVSYIKPQWNRFYKKLFNEHIIDYMNNNTRIKKENSNWQIMNSFNYITNFIDMKLDLIPKLFDLCFLIDSFIDHINKPGNNSPTNIVELNNLMKYINKDAKNFTYNLDKLTFSALLDRKTNINIDDDDLGDFFEAEINDRYIRKPDTFELYDNKFNKNVEESEKLLEEIKDTKCFGTGVGSDDVTFKCEDFILDCLRGDNTSIKKCKQYMTNKGFYKKATEEVDSMIPFMAVKILDAFRVVKGISYDSRVNSNIEKYESYETWIKRIAEINDVNEASATEIAQIKDNNELRHYIKLLIQKVNSNPAILNKKYTGTKYDQCTFDTNKFKDSYFYNLGLRVRNGMPTNFNKSDILRTVSTVSSNLAFLPTSFNFRDSIVNVQRFGRGGLGYFGVPGGFMMGGGVTKYNMYRPSYDILKKSFDNLEKQLEAHDKSISDGNRKTISKFFESYRINEKKIMQVLNYIHRYNEIDRMYGVYDNKNILNMSDFKKIVDNYDNQGNKIFKKTDDISALFTQLLSAVEGRLSSE